MTRDGNWYIATGTTNYTTGFIHKIDASTFTVAASITWALAGGGDCVTAMGLDEAGGIYVIEDDFNIQAFHVTKYNLSDLSQAWVTADTPDPLDSTGRTDVLGGNGTLVLPWNPSFGHYLIFQFSYDQLAVVNRDTHGVVTFSGVFGAGHRDYPTAIAVDGNNDIWVLDDGGASTTTQGLHKVHFADATLTPQITHYYGCVPSHGDYDLSMMPDIVNNHLIVYGGQPADHYIMDLEGHLISQWSYGTSGGGGGYETRCSIKMGVQQGKFPLLYDVYNKPKLAIFNVDGSLVADYAVNFAPTNQYNSAFELNSNGTWLWDAGRNAYVDINDATTPVTANYVRYYLDTNDLQPATVVVTNVDSAQQGDNITFSVRVSGADGVPTGTVVLKDGSTTLTTLTLVSGASSYSTLNLSVGSHAITAEYSGDTKYMASTGSSTVVVAAIPVVTGTPVPGFAIRAVYNAQDDSSLPPTAVLGYYPHYLLVQTPLFILWNTFNVASVRITAQNGSDPVIDTGVVQTSGSGALQLPNGLSVDTTVNLVGYNDSGEPIISTSLLIQIATSEAGFGKPFGLYFGGRRI
jgi:hypothetical protein